MSEIPLSQLIAPAFYYVHEDIMEERYPDKNNHTIDAVRYALESEITNKKARILKRGDFF